jgi:uncharacterized membrane protein YphA (DoxX/SURF4 family)
MNFKQILLYALLAFIGIGFGGAGIMKLMGNPELLTKLYELGYSNWAARALGAVEVLGAVGLLFRKTRATAMVGLLPIAVGAWASHITAGHIFQEQLPAMISICLLVAALDLDDTFDIKFLG